LIWVRSKTKRAPGYPALVRDLTQFLSYYDPAKSQGASCKKLEGSGFSGWPSRYDPGGILSRVDLTEAIPHPIRGS